MSDISTGKGGGAKCKASGLRQLGKLTLWVGQIMALTAAVTLFLWVALRENEPATYLKESTRNDVGVNATGGGFFTFKINIRNQDLYKGLNIEYLLLRIGKPNEYDAKATIKLPKSIYVPPRDSLDLPVTSVTIPNDKLPTWMDPDFNFYVFQVLMQVHFGGVNSETLEIMQSAHVYYEGNGTAATAIVDKKRGQRFIEGLGFVDDA